MIGTSLQTAFWLLFLCDLLRRGLPWWRSKIRSDGEGLVSTLHARYKDNLASPDGDPPQMKDRKFLRGGAARQLVMENAPVIREMYHLYERSRERDDCSLWRCVWRSLWRTKEDVARLEHTAETFFRTIVGDLSDKPSADDGAVKLFADLMLSEIPPHSTVFRSFVQHVLQPPTTGARLSDNVLPFQKLQDVQHWFGKEKEAQDAINRIYLNHYIVCPVLTTVYGATIPPNAQKPYLKEEKLVVDDHGMGIYRVKIDPLYSNGNIPHDWIARKDIPLTHTKEEEVDRRLKKQRLAHAHIRKIYGLARSQDTTHVYMELASEDLQEFMERDKTPSTRLEGKIVWFEKLLHAADGVRFLHHGAVDPSTGVQVPIRHGDIKADNIVLVKDEDSDIQFKISDFGISCIGRGQRQGPSVDQLAFCPPEFLERILPEQERTTKGDVWSMACLILEWLIWLMDEMGNGELRGLRAFHDCYKDYPSPETGETPNCRFFVVRSADESIKQAATQRPSIHGDFYRHVRTDDSDQYVVMQLNPKVVAFVERMYGDDESRSVRAKTFILDVFAVLRKIALVPDPDQRGSMAELCDALKAVVADVRSDMPQKA